MKLKLLAAVLATGVLSIATPAFAHGGGHDRGYGHAYVPAKHWNKHDRYYYPRSHVYYRDRVIVREYVRPVPAYGYYSAPAPGVHIVVPDIYIPWPR